MDVAFEFQDMRPSAALRHSEGLSKKPGLFPNGGLSFLGRSNREDHSMDRYQCRPELSQRFGSPWAHHYMNFKSVPLVLTEELRAQEYRGASGHRPKSTRLRLVSIVHLEPRQRG